MSLNLLSCSVFERRVTSEIALDCESALGSGLLAVCVPISLATIVGCIVIWLERPLGTLAGHGTLSLTTGFGWFRSRLLRPCSVSWR